MELIHKNWKSVKFWKWYITLHYLVTCYLIKLTRPKDATHLKRAHTTRVATKSVFEDQRSSFMKNFRISNTKQCICPQKISECQTFYEYQILNSIHLWILNSKKCDFKKDGNTIYLFQTFICISNKNIFVLFGSNNSRIPKTEDLRFWKISEDRRPNIFVSEKFPKTEDRISSFLKNFRRPKTE